LAGFIRLRRQRLRQKFRNSSPSVLQDPGFQTLRLKNEMPAAEHDWQKKPILCIQYYYVLDWAWKEIFDQFHPKGLFSR
jgi:hypothetical protein